MPFVKASQAKDHLELIKNGTVRKISGFVPDDNGDFILVVFMNPTRMSKLNQSGLGFNADMIDDRRVRAPQEVRQAAR